MPFFIVFPGLNRSHLFFAKWLAFHDKKGNSIEGGLTSAGRHFSCEGLVAAPGAFLIGDGFSQTRKLICCLPIPATLLAEF